MNIPKSKVIKLKDMSSRPKRENTIEDYLVKQVKSLGGTAYKFTSPQRRAVADRLCVLPYGITAFIECKRPGETLSPAQQREEDRLTKLNHWAESVSTEKEVDIFIKNAKYHMEARAQVIETMERGDF